MNITFAREMHKEWVRLADLMTGDFFVRSDESDAPLYFLVDDKPDDPEVYSLKNECFVAVAADTPVLRARPTNITYELVC